MAKFKKNLSKIRKFVKEVAEYYHDEANYDDPRNNGCTWLFGGGELHAYCSNFQDHTEYDFRSGQSAMWESHGRWEGEALNYLRRSGWVFSPKLDVCICPSCAKKHGLIEILKDEDLA